MKKILLLAFLAILFGANIASAQEKIDFIYINGSNTNTEKMATWFYDGINKLHPILKNKIVKDEFMHKKLLKNGSLEINEEPKFLYWGDLSKSYLDALEQEIGLLDRVSPRIAQFTRKFIAECFHDAIWISKYANMSPVIDMLHKKVMDAKKEGNKVVFFGYSAGTFVTYEYFLMKMPVIDIAVIQKELDVENLHQKDFSDLGIEKTCMDALFEADVITYNMTGGLVANSNHRHLKRNIQSLNDYTKMRCAPDDTILGVVNYANPTALFFSDFTNPKYKTEQVRTLAFEHIIENDMFYMNVNFADDPLAIPISKNLTFKETKEITGQETKAGGGFYFDKSDEGSPFPFFVSHTSYFSSARKFSKAIVKAYKQGFTHFYELETKKRSDKSEETENLLKEFEEKY